MIKIDGDSLNLSEVNTVARMNKPVSITEEGRNKVANSHNRVLRIIDKQKPVYGINTGFGIFADQTITRNESKKLNRNLILSHATGTGEPLEAEIVRAAMLIRANALVKGYSGIDVAIVEMLVRMLNAQVIPYVCSKGSLGSSGDLCMLAQMALVFTRGERDDPRESGKAYWKDRLMTGAEAMRAAGLERLELENKDGLALINGATFSAAILALCCTDATIINNLTDIAASLSLEALLGKSAAFHPKLHECRGLTGQMVSAENIRKMINGSNWIDFSPHVQDAYSLRCAPQVHGAVRDAVEFVSSVVTIEINAATDNPLVLDDESCISGGNFHGEPLGLSADFLSIALSEIGAISERRIFRMLDKNLNQGLPPMLVNDSESAGLNSGIMLLQYTAASMALENQTLASPDSVRSLPTSANQEDHNANSFLAAIHAREIQLNTMRILAIELFTACRAIDLRTRQCSGKSMGKRTKKVFDLIRDHIPFHAEDSLWGEQMEVLYNLVFKNHEFLENLQSVLLKE